MINTVLLFEDMYLLLLLLFFFNFKHFCLTIHNTVGSGTPISCHVLVCIASLFLYFSRPPSYFWEEMPSPHTFFPHYKNSISFLILLAYQYCVALGRKHFSLLWNSFSSMVPQSTLVPPFGFIYIFLRRQGQCFIPFWGISKCGKLRCMEGGWRYPSLPTFPIFTEKRCQSIRIWCLARCDWPKCCTAHGSKIIPHPFARG